jgi:ABC-type multidrug transport system ATPase subunit
MTDLLAVLLCNAGKTSLLDLLAGRKESGAERGQWSGSITLNNSSTTTSNTTVTATAGAAGAGAGATATAAAATARACSSSIAAVSGYVTQADVLPGTLTVYEHLLFHAQLRLPRSAGALGCAQRALTVLQELGLSAVADSLIGNEFRRGISGG